MKCPTEKEWTGYSAGDPVSDAFRDHLSTCPRCAEIAREYRSVIQTMQSATVDIISEADFTGMKNLILEQLPERQPRKTIFDISIPFSFRARPVWATLAIAFLITGAIVLNITKFGLQKVAVPVLNQDEGIESSLFTGSEISLDENSSGLLDQKFNEMEKTSWSGYPVSEYVLDEYSLEDYFNYIETEELIEVDNLLNGRT
jgi:hypothetical protein